MPSFVAVFAAAPDPPLFGVSIYWEMPVVLTVVNLVFAAVRHDRWDRIVREAASGWVRLTAGLVAIGVVLHLLSTYL